MNSRKIFFAGGGTAGHIQPALAVARKWKRDNPGDRIVFLGTSSGLETSLVPESGFELQLITRVRVPRKVSLRLLNAPFQLLRAVSEARKILKGGDLLIGFGGYVCAPAYIAAAMKKIPMVIHEANARPGWANRLGALFTQSLAVGMPVADGKFAAALITGIPLRDDIATLLSQNRDWNEDRWDELKSREKEFLGFEPQRPLILVFGGSQGSQAMNTVIEDAKEEIVNKQIQILHSVGGSNVIPASTDHYKPVSYIHDMARAYVAADVIIARSGAITCSEVRALGKFAIFVPLAIGNGEQAVNALELSAHGRAVIIDQESFTSRWLIDNISAMIMQNAKNAPGVDTRDLDASTKITALMDHTLRNFKA